MAAVLIEHEGHRPTVADSAYVAPTELWPVQNGLGFPATVFGIAREELTMAKVSAHYAEQSGRQRRDRFVEDR
jgi:hypothetical protein